MQVYSRLADIPQGHADTQKLQEGCLVLEGGAFRGLYTQGALDALMQNGINIQTTVGVSAGAMGGLNYVSGQIGRSARINLRYRHHPDYVGLGALRRDHGITGFSFAFGEFDEEEPLDWDAFSDPRRRFVAAATDIETGEASYFEKGKCPDILQAIRASATVPYVSLPVALGGRKYLDGGCAVTVPVDWALEQGFQKIFVIRTRDRAYRKPKGAADSVIDLEYGRHPAFAEKLKGQQAAYNALVAHIDELERRGRILVLSPSRPIEIARFEGDMEKLGALYWQGHEEANAMMDEIASYFSV